MREERSSVEQRSGLLARGGEDHKEEIHLIRISLLWARTTAALHTDCRGSPSLPAHPLTVLMATLRYTLRILTGTILALALLFHLPEADLQSTEQIPTIHRIKNSFVSIVDIEVTKGELVDTTKPVVAADKNIKGKLFVFRKLRYGLLS